jgi:hypothetical protein
MNIVKKWKKKIVFAVRINTVVMWELSFVTVRTTICASVSYNVHNPWRHWKATTNSGMHNHSHAWHTGDGFLLFCVPLLLRVQRSLWRQLTNSMAPEPEGSSPHSQQPANGPYPEPGESTPHPPANLPKVHFDPILSSTPWSSKWSPSAIPAKPCTRFSPLPSLWHYDTKNQYCKCKAHPWTISWSNWSQCPTPGHIFTANSYIIFASSPLSSELSLFNKLTS